MRGADVCQKRLVSFQANSRNDQYRDVARDAGLHQQPAPPAPSGAGTTGATVRPIDSGGAGSTSGAGTTGTTAGTTAATAGRSSQTGGTSAVATAGGGAGNQAVEMDAGVAGGGGASGASTAGQVATAGASGTQAPAKVVLGQAETYRLTTTLASRACLRRTRSSLPAPQSVPWNCARGRTVSACPRRRLGLSFLSRLKTYSPSVTTNNLCVPITLTGSLGKALLTKCKSINGAEGRCTSACVPIVAEQAAILPKDVCTGNDLCAPCFDPRTGDDTLACRKGVTKARPKGRRCSTPAARTALLRRTRACPRAGPELEQRDLHCRQLMRAQGTDGSQVQAEDMRFAGRRRGSLCLDVRRRCGCETKGPFANDRLRLQ